MAAKSWVVDDDEGLYFYIAETRGQAKRQHRKEIDGFRGWDHYLDLPPTRRFPAMDGLGVSEINAFRIGAIARAECPHCGTMIYRERDGIAERLVSYGGAYGNTTIMAVTDGDDIWCGEECYGKEQGKLHRGV